MSFPRKEQRDQCYSARDQFWTCLDQQQDKDEQTAHKLCAKEKGLFEQACPTQWVTHFVRKYKYLKFKEKMESGFDPLAEESAKTGQ